MRGRAAALIVASGLSLLLAGGCNRDGGSDADAAPIGSDTRARVPDDKGVVTAVTLEQVTLDGARTYPVSKNLRTFSTYDRQLQPLLGFNNRYVHLGLRDGEVEWMAGIGVVVGTPASVYYTGSLREVDAERQAVFVDGTVLQLGDGVEPPAPGRVVQARIDPGPDVVAEFAG